MITDHMLETLAMEVISVAKDWKCFFEKREHLFTPQYLHSIFKIYTYNLYIPIRQAYVNIFKIEWLTIYETSICWRGDMISYQQANGVSSSVLTAFTCRPVYLFTYVHACIHVGLSSINQINVSFYTIQTCKWQCRPTCGKIQAQCIFTVYSLNKI